MKNKLITITFLLLVFLFPIISTIIPDKEISKSERRKLATFPKFELTNKYIGKIDKYFLDHFVFREQLRSLKAKYNYKILRKLDNNNIYLKDNYIFKSNYPTNKKSIDYFKNNISKVESKLTPNNNSYIMIIPDKNYYLKDDNFLQLDYEMIYEEISQLGIENIDIRKIMKLEDYYETDTHWQQQNLDKVIKKMSEKIGFEYTKYDYNKNIYDEFYGVYYGESAIKRPPEKITYLTNEIINDAKVTYLENPKLSKVYNENQLKSLDAYSVYLDGPSSVIEIENNHNKDGKELIIFRDSFGSSITPLLIPYYSKITVVDNRYITLDNLENYLEFNDQDVLYLYSTLVVNDSFSLKN